MVTQDTINRINELYRKSKAEGLTSAEAEEQKQLRAEYVAAFRNNLRGTLDSIKIQNPDCCMFVCNNMHSEKMKRMEQEALENARKYGN